MSGTNKDVMEFAYLAALYSAGYQRAYSNEDASKHRPVDLAMYVYHDAIKRTATAFMAVCDGKRKPGEALQDLRDYADHLKVVLTEKDDANG